MITLLKLNSGTRAVRIRIHGDTYHSTRFPEARHVSDEEWLRQSVHESEVRSYWIGYPGRQKMAGRDVRKSPLWDACSRKGAFFGLGGGHWEVPKFYMPGMQSNSIKIIWVIF